MTTNSNEPPYLINLKQLSQAKQQQQQLVSDINQNAYIKPSKTKLPKDFDVLDRELQLKILSSEREKLQFGLIDFIESRKDKAPNSELDPFAMPDGKPDTLNFSTEKIKKIKLRKSVVLSNKIIELSHSKSFNEDHPHEGFNKSNRCNSLSEPEMPLLFSSKSPSVKPRGSPLMARKSSLVDTEEGGLKLKLLSHEKSILKESFMENDEEEPKPIMRELIKMKQVYDSCSDEEIEAEEDTLFTIYPHSYFKYTWDLIIFLLTLFSMVYIPLAIAMDISSPSEVFVDVMFIIDLLLNFAMGYYDHEENLIVSPNKVVKNYVTGWFWVDLFACMPFSSINYFKGLALHLKFLALCSLVKYFKINNSTNFYQTKLIKKLFCFSRSVKHYVRNRMQVSHGVKSLLINIFRFIAVVHILSCIWIYLSRLSPGENWTIKYNDNAPDYQSRLYLVSVYFNMVSVLTLGYGDVLPVSFIERFYSIFLLIMSLGINTYAVSFLENFADLGNQRDSKLEDKKDFLEAISINYRVNFELYEKILGFLNYTYKGCTDEKEKFIDYLPTSLKNVLICNMYQDIIDNFTFFKLHRDDNIEFKARILLSLRPVIAYKGEEVIKVDQFVDEIIFVKSGQLSMFITFKDFHIRLLYLRKYEHFGEMLVLTREKSPIGLKVISQHKTELLLLRKADFIAIVNDFNDNFKHIFDRSNENMKRIMKIIRQKKAQIRRMITQTKTFKQFALNSNLTAKRTSNLNNTLDFFDNMNKRQSFLNNTPINSPHQQQGQGRQSVALNKSNPNEEIKITLNVNNQTPQTQQNVFININSQNTSDFKGVKEINVTINNNNSSNDNVNAANTPTNLESNAINTSFLDFPRKEMTGVKFGSVVNTAMRPTKQEGRERAIQLKLDEALLKKRTDKKTKSSTDLLSIDNTADGSFIHQNLINETLEQNNTKKVYLNIYNSIRKKVVDKSEAKKLDGRLNQMCKQYLDLDIENTLIQSISSDIK